MLPVKKNPLGFKNLRTWQQANEILELTDLLAASFPVKNPATGQYLTDLKDQMIRSARSVVRNIEEGFARNTTAEYIQFLGYSYGSLQELIGDYEYCLKGNLGDKERAERGYYLCKGVAKMLTAQIKALEAKTVNEKTLSQSDHYRRILEKQDQEKKRQDAWLKDMQEKIKRGEPIGDLVNEPKKGESL